VSVPTSLAEQIADRRIHVIDGAMGTLLYSRGVFVNVCYDALVLEDPELVLRIHEEYVRAGAELLETNTFGANPVKLSAYGLDTRAVEINARAAALALRAARGRALVLGSVGPLGIRLEPWGPTGAGEAEAHFGPQIDGLLEGGVHGFVLETFADVNELAAALRAVRSRSALPVFAQMTVGEDGATVYGAGAEALARELHGLGADVIGLNCSVGPAAMLDALESMAEATERPLVAQPNAGLPRTVGDRKMYMASPEYMARYARRLIEVGVRFIGGCCGTTPEHIKQLASTVASLQPKYPALVARPSVRGEEPHPRPEPFALEARSALGRRLAKGDFVTTVELLPPRGWDLTGVIEGARTAHAAGIDAVSVVDSPGGRTRTAAIPSGMIVMREAGIEPLVHYTCRDRNMLGMLSDLLGAAAGGVRNLLLVSGDPPVQGPYPDATAVFDIDSIGLTNLVAELNRGLDPGGGTLVGGPTRFVMGVAVDPGAPDLDREVERFRWKVEAGADFAITQPLFDAASLERFLERTATWRIPVLAGLWPLTSLRNAEFLANEVPGVRVPDQVVERMRRAQESGDGAAREEGVAIARETLAALRPMIQGLHLSAPGGDVAGALRVLDGFAPQPPVRVLAAATAVDHGAPHAPAGGAETGRGRP